ALAFDQRGLGFARVSHGTADIGAFEVQNPPPTAVDDQATTAEDAAVVVAVLANDSDPDGEPLTVTTVGTPAHGTATIQANGTIRSAPPPDYNGRDSSPYPTPDGGGPATATVRVNVTAVNDAPMLSVPATQTTAQDIPVTIASIAVSDVDAAAG